MIVGSLVLIVAAAGLLLGGLALGSDWLLGASIAGSLLAALLLYLGARQAASAPAEHPDHRDGYPDDEWRSERVHAGGGPSYGADYGADDGFDERTRYLAAQAGEPEFGPPDPRPAHHPGAAGPDGPGPEFGLSNGEFGDPRFPTDDRPFADHGVDPHGPPAEEHPFEDARPYDSGGHEFDDARGFDDEDEFEGARRFEDVSFQERAERFRDVETFEEQPPPGPAWDSSVTGQLPVQRDAERVDRPAPPEPDTSTQQFTMPDPVRPAATAPEDAHPTEPVTSFVPTPPPADAPPPAWRTADAESDVEWLGGGMEEDDPKDEPPIERRQASVAAAASRLTMDVFVIDGRPRYHVVGCVHLLGREAEPLPVDEAVDLGFTPCGLCEPDSALTSGRSATASQ